MVTLYKDKLIIELSDPDPKEKLNELRKAITKITSVSVASEDMKFHSDLPDAIAELIGLLGELHTSS